MNSISNGKIILEKIKGESIIIIPCIFLLICAGLFFAAMCVISKRKKVETINDISNSWLGYKTIIPLYSIVGAAHIVTENSRNSCRFTIVHLTVLMLVGYFIYRRGFKISKNDVIVILAVGLLSSVQI